MSTQIEITPRPQRANRISRAEHFVSALLGGLAAALILIGFVAWRYGIRFTLTHSVGPATFFHKVDAPPGRGDLVLVCLPADIAQFGKERGYLHAGYGCSTNIEPVTKVLSAVAGDTVTVTPAMLMRIDNHGRVLPHYKVGKFVIPPGKVWILGTVWNSWDSRYFGPVPAVNILTREDTGLGLF